MTGFQRRCRSASQRIIFNYSPSSSFAPPAASCSCLACSRARFWCVPGASIWTTASWHAIAQLRWAVWHAGGRAGGVPPWSCSCGDTLFFGARLHALATHHWRPPVVEEGCGRSPPWLGSGCFPPCGQHSGSAPVAAASHPSRRADIPSPLLPAIAVMPLLLLLRLVPAAGLDPSACCHGLPAASTQVGAAAMASLLLRWFSRLDAESRVRLGDLGFEDPTSLEKVGVGLFAGAWLSVGREAGESGCNVVCGCLVVSVWGGALRAPPCWRTLGHQGAAHHATPTHPFPPTHLCSHTPCRPPPPPSLARPPRRCPSSCRHTTRRTGCLPR